jgi:flagellar hook-associated protein 2
MVDSIAKTLGAGSGIDVTALVSSLVEAQYSVKTKQIDTRSETLTAQISAVSSLKSGITGFSNALSTLVKSGSLTTQPSSSNTAVAKVTAISGAKISGLNTGVEVRALAGPQVLASTSAVPAGQALGTGDISIQFGSYDANGAWADASGTPPAAITIAAGDATLAGIAAKINAAPGWGVTATVMKDGNGEKLVLKGGDGAERAFKLTATDPVPADSGVLALSNVLGIGADGMKVEREASDARVAVDGVEVRRNTNSISDLVAGVKIDLQSASIGTRVAITASVPTEGLKQAVNDVVATYNELNAMLKEATDPVNGKLARDSAAREMQRALRQLTLTDLTGAGSPKSLADVGVTTNRDGTLSVDAARLDKVIAASPDAVEAMFADRGTGASGKGLSAALASIATAVTSRTTGLGASEVNYSTAQGNLAKEKAKVADQQESTSQRLTRQFAGMDARVAAYKATQTFLTQQVDAWNAKQ